MWCNFREVENEVGGAVLVLKMRTCVWRESERERERERELTGGRKKERIL